MRSSIRHAPARPAPPQAVDRRRRAKALVAATVVGAAVGLAAHAADVLPRLEHDTVALRFALRAAEPPPDVAVVAIDDRTFDELGAQWPLKRRRHAKAIDRLDQAGARTIVYDIQFTEPTTPREDLALYDAVARAGGVVLATTETDERGGTKVLGGDENLRAASARAGAANLRVEPGGVVQRFQYEVGGLKTLPVVALEAVSGRAEPRAKYAGGAWIDYHGPPGTVPTYSFADVAGDDPDPALLGRLKGKIVVVGASAPSLHDVHATPADGHRLMSGPELQANAIQTALDGVPLRDAPPWTAWLAIFALAAAPAAASVRLRVLLAALLTPVVGLAYLGIAQLAFEAGHVLTVAYPLVALIAGTLAMALTRYVLEHRERRLVALRNDVLEERVRERTRELVETQIELVERLAQAAESRDTETGAHVERMSRMCGRVARELGHTPAEAERLRLAAALHDIGKLAIPDRVLHKPGRLDADEWALMQSHTTAGADMLAGSRTPLVQLAEQIARSHHERWDGTGYPQGLAGEAIPLAARISALCDVFDALISRRAYKDAWPLDDAVEAILRERGRHFDPAVVDAFERLVPELRAQVAAPELPFVVAAADPDPRSSRHTARMRPTTPA